MKKEAILLLTLMLVCTSCTVSDEPSVKINRYENSEIIESAVTGVSSGTEMISEHTDGTSRPSYKTAQILYDEFLDFKCGKYEDWWIDEVELPHMCASVLVFDLNSDGNFEILSQKYTCDFKKYYTLYSFDGELLFRSYDDFEQLYYDGNTYCIEFRQPPWQSIILTIADADYDSETYLPVQSDYLYVNDKVEAYIYEQFKANSPPFDNGAFCRSFAPDSGFELYYGDYTSQTQQLSEVYKSKLENYHNIGSISDIINENLNGDFFAVNISQIEIVDLDKLAYILSPLDSFILDSQ